VDALNASIDNAFSTLGLLLVFIFVLFDLRFPQITAKIEAEIPDKKRMKERQIHRRELRKCLWQKGLPLMLVYAAVVYLMLPLLVRVVASSRLDPRCLRKQEFQGIPHFLPGQNTVRLEPY